MDKEKLIENLNRRGYIARYFETSAEAKAYLEKEIKGEDVGFGGSVTTQQLGLYDLLGKQNTVYWHWMEPNAKEKFAKFTTYITSANAVSETGELVNIDGTGNRVASTLYGPKKLYFVLGKNKVASDLPAAIDMARNVAAPANAKRLGRSTPCVKAGKCMDCMSPERICRAMVIYMRPTGGFSRTEVIIIGEDLGA